MAIPVAAQQSIHIQGKILSESGISLGGATIRTKLNKSGKINNVLADDQGIFTLRDILLNERYTLYFDHIGYESDSIQNYQVLSSEYNSLLIRLVQKSNRIDDIVVIGYGTQTRRTITGAISSINAHNLKDMPVMRLEDALKGRVSGVLITASSGIPGSPSNVNIRGITSINGGNPLYIVDGIPIDGGIDYLNPSDIYSIEVLKDGASAAIYGTKAGAGVIIITTKKGKAGKTQINFTGYYGLQSPERQVNVLNPEQYAILRNESYLAANPDKDLLFPNPKAFKQETNWQNEIFNKSAPIHNTEINLIGGNEKSDFYFSAGHHQQFGIVLSEISNYQRFNTRINSNHQINKWIKFGENIAYAKTKNQGEVSANNYLGGTPLISALNLDPISPVFVSNDDWLMQEPYFSNQQFLVRNTNGIPFGISPYVKEMANPLAFAETRKGNFYWGDKFAGSVFLEIEPIKDLKIKSMLGFDYAFWGTESFFPKFYMNETFYNKSNTSFNRDINKSLTWIWTNTATFSKSFGAHNLAFLLGSEAIDRSAQFGLNGDFRNIPADKFEDASLNFPIIAENTVATGWDAQPYTMASYFARATYDFAGKYLFTGVLRRDGSSHFGRNNLYATFPAFSLGWNIHQEAFWKKNEIINNLKLRVGYGVNGNENIAPFLFVSTVGSAGMYVVGDQIELGNAPQAPANQDLKWEKIQQTNLGIDALIFQNFNISLDYFTKKTDDMLLAINLPAYVGATATPYGNIASMINKGLELELSYQKKFNAFQLNLSANTSYIQNKVTNLGVNEFLSNAGFQAASYEISRKMVNQPVNFFYGFEQHGIFQNQQEVNSYLNSQGELLQPNAVPGDFKWADLNADGKIDADDRTYLGNPTPSWMFGFHADVMVKNFDLKVFAQGVSGNKIFQQLRRLDVPSANYLTSALERWTGEGSTNSYPRLSDIDLNGNFTNPSSFYLHNGSFLRVKTLQIGYNFQKEQARKYKIEHIRFYLSANNLFTLTPYNGFDPEIGGALFGIDRGIYPQARSFSFGLNLTL
ncbi:SusC/RagA family TonB-linked outer membrane protein [Sphingobacterium sp. HJSM2_6]|uniref:SusC/RagA family TonB-linked outer membrane protein n=1 Tax=Sphingobacterium sp. HJSM2_6 TaxID=3366264 RepID=UPI003BC44207